MKPVPLALLCLSCLTGSMAGSWLALSPRVSAEAQTQQMQPLNSRPVQNLPKTDDKLTIPDGGLPIVNSRNTLLGRFVLTGNGLNLVLMNRNGQPSVSLEAGTGGLVTVGATDQQAGISIANTRGGRASTLVGADQAVTLLSSRDKKFQVEVGNESSLVLPGKGSGPLLSLKTLPDGGSLVLNSRDGKTLFEVVTSLEKATLTLDDPKGGAKLTANNKGELGIHRNGSLAWQPTITQTNTRTGEGSTTLPPGGGGGR